MTDPSEPPILDKIRNMWEFAAITQFFYLFFDIFGLEDFDVDVFEDELIGIKEPNLISQARLRLLQGLSSNRAITLENLDEFTRKQYIKRKPNANPFGDEENPTSWNELDVFAHIRVLRQLCTWQLINPERFRERANVKDSEQLEWRVNPVGFDAEGNTYYLFDDNRLYYRDAPVIPEDKPSKRRFRGKKRKRGARRIVESEEPESPPPTNGVDEIDEDSTWHVQCISVDDYNPFLARLKKSRDPDEKAMYRHLHDNVLPAVIAEEEEREQKRQIKEQEYLKEQAYAARKRSNRLVQKEEDRKHMQERELELSKLQAEEEERKREEQRLKKLEQEREARLLLREQRQRERELRIQQREEERKRAMEEAEKTGQPIKISIKMSESPAPIKKTSRQKALESQRGTAEPQSQPPPEESWFFDCLCGKHGVNYDDGGYTVACEKCEIWQHVDCLPNPQDREELNKRKDVAEGTYPDYEFVCARCRKKAKEAAKLEGGKTKDQLRKEREREINRAKYERRKIREKAKKEEERRKREEEQRLGIQSSAGGQPTNSPSGEIRVLGVSSSSVPASSSPERTSMATGHIYSLSQFTPPSQYLNANPSPPYVAQPSNQNVIRSPPTQFPQNPNPPQTQTFPQPHYRQLPQQPPQRSQHSSSSQPQTLRQSPYLPPQNQPPRQPQQYQSLRPAPPAAVPAYWSPYTTSPTLPNGQSFPNSRPYPAPYSNGVNTQPRAVPIKPAPNQGFRPPQHGVYSMPTSQEPERRPSSQSPVIQPRRSKSPEIQRPPLQAPLENSPNLSHERELVRKTDPPRQDSGWNVHFTERPNETSSPQNHPSQTVRENHSHPQYRERNNSWKSPPSQRNSLSPLLSQPPSHLSPSAQQRYQHSNSSSPQQIFKNENGSAPSPVNRLAPASANVRDNTDEVDDKTAPEDNTLVNGVVGDQDQGTSEMAKENERTKMAFLLN